MAVQLYICLPVRFSRVGITQPCGHIDSEWDPSYTIFMMAASAIYGQVPLPYPEVLLHHRVCCTLGWAAPVAAAADIHRASLGCPGQPSPNTWCVFVATKVSVVVQPLCQEPGGRPASCGYPRQGPHGLLVTAPLLPYMGPALPNGPLESAGCLVKGTVDPGVATQVFTP